MVTAIQFAKAIPAERESGRLLTPDEVAEMIGISTETLAQWRSQRRGIPFVKISRSVVRYRHCDLENFLTARIVRVEVERNDVRRSRP